MGFAVIVACPIFKFLCRSARLLLWMAYRAVVLDLDGEPVSVGLRVETEVKSNAVNPRLN